MGGYYDEYEYRNDYPFNPRGSDFHGCSVRIFGQVLVGHEDQKGLVSYPTIRSYKDGIKVGCTFVTNEAFEQIYKWHKDFLATGDSKTHQS